MFQVRLVTVPGSRFGKRHGFFVACGKWKEDWSLLVNIYGEVQ
jgi:hypothetical protein